MTDDRSGTATVLKRLRKLMRKGKAADPMARPSAVAVANTVQKLRLELSGAHESEHDGDAEVSRPRSRSWW